MNDNSFILQKLYISAPLWIFGQTSGEEIARITKLEDLGYDLKVTYAFLGSEDKYTFSISFEEVENIDNKFLLANDHIIFISFHMFFDFMTRYVGRGGDELMNYNPANPKAEVYIGNGNSNTLDWYFDSYINRLNKSEYKKYEKYIKK